MNYAKDCNITASALIYGDFITATVKGTLVRIDVCAYCNKITAAEINIVCENCIYSIVSAFYIVREPTKITCVLDLIYAVFQFGNLNFAAKAKSVRIVMICFNKITVIDECAVVNNRAIVGKSVVIYNRAVVCKSYAFGNGKRCPLRDYQGFSLGDCNIGREG